MSYFRAKKKRMATTIKNPSVDAFLLRSKTWRAEFEKLREIVCTLGLTEEVKWGNPCYVLDKSNVVLIHGFKDYCALLFFKGALVKDPEGILIQQTENVQAARQIRFTSLKQITAMEGVLKTYIHEAIEVEKQGLKVVMKKQEDLVCPDEFQEQLDRNPDLEKAFKALTPGRQRVYILHFSEPKQIKTRESRVQKCIPSILEGKGLYD
jgi:uncharacterized protein YdeI (YjbR/CyaY-like superfamily)